MANQTVPEYDSFIGSGNATILGRLPAGRRIGPIKQMGTFGTCRGMIGIRVCVEGTTWVSNRERPLDSWFPIAVNNKLLVQLLPQTHTSALLSGEVDPWETAGDLVTEPELENIDTARSAAAAADDEGEETETDPWDGHSLVSSSVGSLGCRASISDDDGERDYLPFTEEELTQRINRHAERRKRIEEQHMQFMEALLYSS